MYNVICVSDDKRFDHLTGMFENVKKHIHLSIRICIYEL